MYVVGLTGNVATGKSTVARMLGDLGAEVIDADALAHGVMRAGTAAHARIVARFGAAVLDAAGELDRRRLGEIVFRDPEALAALEAIIHPAVIDETLRLLGASDRAVCVVEAIKLLEADMLQYCDALWVTACPRAQQLERMVRTRGLTPAQAALRIDAQPPAEDKISQADVIIDTGTSLRATWLQVVRAWNAIPGAARISPDSEPTALTEPAAHAEPAAPAGPPAGRGA